MTLPWTVKTARETAQCLHDRIRTGLEWLSSSAPRALRDPLLAEARAAFTKSNVAALKKLLRQTHLLARSVGTPLDSVYLIRKPKDSAPQEAKPPAPARWSAVSGPAPFPRRREHAPLQCPWGKEPPPRPRSSSDYLPGKPDHLLPAANRERVAALRRWYAQQGEPEIPICSHRRSLCSADDTPGPNGRDDPE